jgi:hypothetical protein
MSFRELIEATLSQVARKQKSITRRFPDFFTNPEKVKGVIDKGGLRMTKMEEDTWEFKIHSGSEEGLWYDAVLRWKNLVPELQRAVADRRNWNKAKTKVDLKKLAAKLFKSGDVELSCSCPAQLYYGGDYILSKDKYRAKYGEPENRPPEKNNPKEYGAHCKHLQALMKALPFYKSTMASHLKKEYGKVIADAEAKASAELTKFKGVAGALKKRKRESIEEDISTISDPRLKKMFIEDKIENLQDKIQSLQSLARGQSKGLQLSMIYSKIDAYEKEIADLKRRESIEEITASAIRDELGVIKADGGVKNFGDGETHGWVKARNPEFKQAMDYWVVGDQGGKPYLILRIYIPLTSDQVVSANKILSRYPEIENIAVALKPTLTGYESTIDIDVPANKHWAARVRQEY